MNRNIFGLIVIIMIIFVAFLSSCGDGNKEFTILYKRQHALSTKKCSTIIKAKDRAEAVIKFKIYTYTSTDSISIDHIYIINN